MSTTTVIRLVANDTKPDLVCQLTDPTTGDPIDLTSTSKVVKFEFRRKNSWTKLFTATCTKVSGGESAGWVSMTWPADALEIAKGYYKGRFLVEDGSDVQTCPDEQTFHVSEDYAA